MDVHGTSFSNIAIHRRNIMAKAINVIEAAIVKLAGIEKDSKALIAEVVIDCLDALHENGQSAVCNKLLLALSPANKRVVYAFMKEFSGFSMDKDEGMKKKIQAQMDKGGNITSDKYSDAKIAFTEFKASGNNIWLWYAAFGQPNTEAKPLDLNKVQKTVSGFAEKAKKQGIQQIALFNALINGAGFEQQEVLDMLAELAKPVKIGE